MRIRLGIASILIAGLAWITFAQGVPGEAPVEVRIPVIPAPAHVSGHVIFAYELHVTNLLPREISPNRVQVFGGNSGTNPIISYDEENLISAIRQYGVASQPADTRKIPAGLRAVIYMWIAVDKSKEVP
ncbi:MAG TPA: hypothetical protein VFO86_15485, partial [Terriglobia bacterium]|nr:hypothetical protein [Terriglobia bacterium]